jgi:putative transposase
MRSVSVGKTCNSRGNIFLPKVGNCIAESNWGIHAGIDSAKQGITPDQLTLHADRGTSMTSKTVAFLLADLGVTKTHSRPQVSNDNPFSESQFKTMKYQPTFPDRFACLADARAFCHTFFDWYNHEHRHTGIGLMPPAAIHYGLAGEMYEQRQMVLNQAYQAHPERFVRQQPQPPALPDAVWINPPGKEVVPSIL